MTHRICFDGGLPTAAGIAEPIKGGVEVGLRLGLGKAEEDRHYTAAENIVRKRLEVEVQADEDAERTQRREVRQLSPPGTHRSLDASRAMHQTCQRPHFGVSPPLCSSTPSIVRQTRVVVFETCP